ncbi:MAG: hypothetical protein KDK51_06680 [Deltaproteobacteria bacterium]|nr:hypothetical protein [Deltaproteobacteria bacterium]
MNYRQNYAINFKPSSFELDERSQKYLNENIIDFYDKNLPEKMKIILKGYASSLSNKATFMKTTEIIAILKSIGEFDEQNKTNRLTVHEHQVYLSYKRVEAVANFLIEGGIPKNFIVQTEFKGYEKDSPTSRRVDILLIP